MGRCFVRQVAGVVHEGAGVRVHRHVRPAPTANALPAWLTPPTMKSPPPCNASPNSGVTSPEVWIQPILACGINEPVANKGGREAYSQNRLEVSNVIEKTFKQSHQFRPFGCGHLCQLSCLLLI